MSKFIKFLVFVVAVAILVGSTGLIITQKVTTPFDVSRLTDIQKEQAADFLEANQPIVCKTETGDVLHCFSDNTWAEENSERFKDGEPLLTKAQQDIVMSTTIIDPPVWFFTKARLSVDEANQQIRTAAIALLFVGILALLLGINSGRDKYGVGVTLLCIVIIVAEVWNYLTRQSFPLHVVFISSFVYVLLGYFIGHTKVKNEEQ